MQVEGEVDGRKEPPASKKSSARPADAKRNGSERTNPRDRRNTYDAEGGINPVIHNQTARGSECHNALSYE